MIAPVAGRVGIFGGTFDPPHIGHLIVARDAAEALRLDRLLLVVAARPPHKDPDGSPYRPSPPELRLEMVRAAVRDDPVLEASDLELRRPGPSYTVDTLRELRAGSPAAELFLLLGADQWREFGSWRDPEAIGGLATVAVMAREGQDPRSTDPGADVSCRPVPVRRIDLSSSEIRRRVREGRSIRDLVPDTVRALIEREGLYAAPATYAVGAAGRGSAP